MSETDDGPLPRTWVRTSLGELLTGIEAGASFKCEERPPTESEIGIVKVSAVTWGEYDEEESKTVTDPGRIDPRLFVAPGDLLFSRANTINLVGACVIARKITKHVMLSDKILRLKVRAVDPRWVLYYLRSAHGRRHIERLATGNQESMRNIGQDRIRMIPIPLAPPREASRIVDEIEKQLTRIDAGVAALKRIQANLKRQRAAILKAACEGRLVPTEAELALAEGRSYEPAEKLLERIQPTRLHSAKKKTESTQPPTDGLRSLPTGWIYVSLRQLAAFITSGSRGWAEYYADEGAIFVRAQDIKTDRLELASAAHVDIRDGAEGTRTRVQRNDILVTITGANVTKSAIVDVSLDEAYVSQHVALLRLLDPDLSPYVYNWIVSPAHGRRQLERLAYGAGKPGLNLDNVKDVIVALPPLAEQRRVCEELQARMSILESVEKMIARNIARAEGLRQAVLRQAFEGKLLPQDPNDEPASALLDRLRAEQPQPAPDGPKRRAPRRRNTPMDQGDPA